MPNPNAVIARAIRIDPEQGRNPAAILRERGDIPVQLDGERVVRIAASNERAAGFAQVLGGLAQIGRPAYLEVDPGTSEIVRIQIPLIGAVESLRDGKDGLEFVLTGSHAVLKLGRDNPYHGEFAAALREGLGSGRLLIVSFDELHQLLDVRLFVPGPDDGPLPDWPPHNIPFEPIPWWKELWWWFWRWRLWPWNWYRCISPARAQQVFDAMSATTCNPLTVPPPCIPFMYPDDGCWGRAHEMVRLMTAMGLKPKKVWIRASTGYWLHALTRNNPACFVEWGWHVAPTLCVRTGWITSERMVIDPSLFTTPVSQATWKGVQGDPNATLTPSDADVFHLWSNQTDPTYSKTNQVLATYRTALYNRSIQIGPPPYANCP